MTTDEKLREILIKYGQRCYKCFEDPHSIITAIKEIMVEKQGEKICRMCGRIGTRVDFDTERCVWCHEIVMNEIVKKPSVEQMEKFVGSFRGGSNYVITKQDIKDLAKFLVKKMGGKNE